MNLESIKERKNKLLRGERMKETMVKITKCQRCGMPKYIFINCDENIFCDKCYFELAQEEK